MFRLLQQLRLEMNLHLQHVLHATSFFHQKHILVEKTSVDDCKLQHNMFNTQSGTAGMSVYDRHA